MPSMSRYKKITLWVIGSTGTILILLLALLLLLPKLINLQPVKGKILANLSRTVGGQVEFHKVDLSFFPRLRVLVHQASVSIPGKLTGDAESVTIYPEILSLLTGRVRIAVLKVQAPDVKMKLPERPEKNNERLKAFSLATIKEKAVPVLAFAALKASGLVVQVEGGRLSLSEKNRSIFWFQDIRAHVDLPPNKLKIDFTCKSNLWESLSLKGWLDSRDLKSNLRIDLTHFRPQALTAYLLRPGPQRVGDSQVNLTLNFKTDGLKALQAELKGSIPYLTLQQENQRCVVKGKSLKAGFHMDQNKTIVSLAELNLDYPQLNISGKLVMDQTSPRVSLELEGTKVDVHSTREAALAVAGNIPITQEIFDILKGGTVPLITFHAHGNSVADLAQIENMLIKGSIREGKISVPEADMDFKGVSGDVVISQGILEGKNLEARLENSRGREGILRWGLKGENDPFHLEMVVKADLVEVPPFLKSLIKNETFRKEMARTSVLGGNALGRLVLGESITSLRASIDVAELNLSARYERMPYLLKIDGGRFFTDGDKIDAENLCGKLGKSSFCELSGQFDWEKAPHLDILSGKFLISLDEIYPWLSSFQRLSNELKDFKSVKGTVAISEASLKGPLLRPRNWRFQIAGEVGNLAMNSDLFSGPVTLTQGKFNVTREKLSITFPPGAILIRGEGSRIALGGDVSLSPAGLLLDMDLSADGLEWDQVRKILESKNRERDVKQAEYSWCLPVKGILRLKSGNFQYGGFTWSPFHADISFLRDRLEVAITKANLCGISTPGILKITPQDLQVDFKPVSRDQELDTTLTCLGNKKGPVTGRFDFEGQIMGKGKSQDLARSLRGNLEFVSSNGRIYRYGLLAKIFALLNLTEIFRGKLPDVVGEGFAYNSIRVKGNLQNGKLALNEAIIDGSSIGIVCEGDIDLLDKNLDLTVLVAPLKTVDSILKKIPLVSHILGGTLVSIPVKVTGDWGDPTVTPLSASAVGSGLLGVMERTLNLPIKIIEFLLPQKQE